MREIQELRPLTAGRLLSIWRSCRESSEDPLERTLLCNGQILAECCFSEGAPVFSDGESALRALTGREMESLLERIAQTVPGVRAEVNPGFDPRRFQELREG